MGSRFVRPDTRTLQISDGDWLIVKRRLNTGEQRDLLARSYTEIDGVPQFRRLDSGIAMVAAYLLDWSLTDDAGKAVVIRDKSTDDVTAMLNALDPDDFAEIKAAVETHEQAMELERAEEKKRRAGAISAPSTSPSRVVVTGALSGSVS